MAIAIDATTPPAFSSTNTLSITSASFSPPAGALLLLMFGGNNPTATTDTSLTSVTNTGTAATWTRRARKNMNAASTGGAAGTSGGAEMWTAVAPGGAITVTANGVGSQAGTDKFGKIMVLTGADTTNLANVAATFSTSGLPSVTVPSNQIGSYVFAMSTDWAQKGLGTAGTAQTIIDEYNLAGEISMHSWRTTSTLAAAGSQTMNLTLPTTENYNLVGMEVRATGAAASSAIPRPIAAVRQAINRAAVI